MASQYQNGDDSDSIATDFGSFNDSCSPLIASEYVDQLINTLDVASVDKELNVDNGTQENLPVKYTTIKTRILDDQPTAKDCTDETLEMNGSSANVDEPGIFYDNSAQSPGTSPRKSCHDESCSSNSNTSTPKSDKVTSIERNKVPLLIEPDQNILKAKADRKRAITSIQGNNQSGTEEENEMGEYSSNKRKREDLDLTPRRKSQRLQNMSIGKNSESNLNCTKQSTPSLDGETNILKAQEHSTLDVGKPNCEDNNAVGILQEECWDLVPLNTAELVKPQINDDDPISDIHDTDEVQQTNSEISNHGDDSASNNGNDIGLTTENIEDPGNKANESKPLQETKGGFFHRAQDVTGDLAKACSIM